jgi:NodT family efflux transporter outer membrane factor (OMF) lipoprotein
MRKRAWHLFELLKCRIPSRLRGLGIIALVGVVFLNSGCIFTGPMEYIHNSFKVGPNYKTPPAEVAPEWIEANDPRIENRHLDDWWTVFQDPVLESLIATAHDKNLTLRAAGERVLQARAQMAISVGNLFPQTQQATSQFSRTSNSLNAANNPTALVLPPGSPDPFTNHFSNFQGGFTLNWELDLWGRLRRNIESSEASLQVSVANYDDVLVTLLADVATNYVQYRVAEQRIKIAQENVTIQEGILKLVEGQVKLGLNKRTQVDVEQAKTVLEQTRSTIPSLQIALGQANDNLCTLLAIPPADLAVKLGAGPKVGVNPMANTPTSVAADIPANLLRQRPDIRAAERQVAAQSAQIGVAEADLYPTLAINGSLGWSAQDVNKLFESNSFFGSITPNVKWNILNYGRIVNNVHLQDFKTQELVATYQNKVLSAAREVQTSLRGFLRSQEQAKHLDLSAKAATAAVDLGVKRYEKGLADFNTVFNLEGAQVQQQDQLALTQGNIALNLINVYRALGGGWELGAHAGCNDANHPAALVESLRTKLATSDIDHASKPKISPDSLPCEEQMQHGPPPVAIAAPVGGGQLLPVTPIPNKVAAPKSAPRVPNDALAIRLVAPNRVPVGKPALFQIQVTNQSAAPLAGMVLYGFLPEGFTTPMGSNIQGAVDGVLEPGHTKTLNMPASTVKPGRYQVNVRVTTKNGLEATSQATVEITSDQTVGDGGSPPYITDAKSASASKMVR